MPRPNPSDYPSFYDRYVALAQGDDVVKSMLEHTETYIAFLSSIPGNKLEYRYAPGKWTIPEILRHIIDTERVFIYRALVFARKDNVPLPGFDQDAYAAAVQVNAGDWDALIEEFKFLRHASISLFKSFPAETLNNIGTVNGNKVNVNSIGFIIMGHPVAHQQVIEEKYL
ncbi:damage-inducible protein DinB [Chitinophaga caeni]|uniref:Damage-inducible protein DinB n=1 Tax=Chitinophaga caeni TaxID=2029983 RepID=A0A291QUN8_9BACT|nr:DinB family protein [Chitinophaga caeni]ATL47670.1 damage-inducible protein DinB [Chitinophaga caeni]